MRADVAVQGSQAVSPPVTAGAERGIAELIAELASAGLVSVEMGDDGDASYALTSQGQLVAQLMVMSGDAHARVLLGALVVSSDRPN